DQAANGVLAVIPIEPCHCGESAVRREPKNGTNIVPCNPIEIAVLGLQQTAIRRIGAVGTERNEGGQVTRRCQPKGCAHAVGTSARGNAVEIPVLCLNHCGGAIPVLGSVVIELEEEFSIPWLRRCSGYKSVVGVVALIYEVNITIGALHQT